MTEAKFVFTTVYAKKGHSTIGMLILQNQRILELIRCQEQLPEIQALQEFLSADTVQKFADFDPDFLRHRLGGSETNQIACVKWQSRHYITGTDIVRIIVYRVGLLIPQHQLDAVMSPRKFEEGVYSVLRGRDAVSAEVIVEEAGSSFLLFLQRNGCVRTKKKQKVFPWAAVKYDKILHDCLDRIVRAKRQSEYTRRFEIAAFFGDPLVSPASPMDDLSFFQLPPQPSSMKGNNQKEGDVPIYPKFDSAALMSTIMKEHQKVFEEELRHRRHESTVDAGLNKMTQVLEITTAAPSPLPLLNMPLWNNNDLPFARKAKMSRSCSGHDELLLDAMLSPVFYTGSDIREEPLQSETAKQSLGKRSKSGSTSSIFDFDSHF